MSYRKGDTLPCFYYILTNIKEGNNSTASKFALAYIQYLRNSGITDINAINLRLDTMTLLAQHNHIGRRTPLELKKIKGTDYSFSTDEEFDVYLTALLNACKEPESFSSLYGKVDKGLSMCHLCPCSCTYSLSYRREELLLARCAIADVMSLSSVLENVDDIHSLFCSYDNLYDILGGVTKPITFPGIAILISSIYENATVYFGGIFESKTYPLIASAFKKKLSQYGVRSVKNHPLCDDFDRQIYDYLLSQMENVFLETGNNDIVTLKDTLLNRQPYVPLLDADATPVYKKPSAKKSASIKRGAKTIDVYDLPSAESIGLSFLDTDVVPAPSESFQELLPESSGETVTISESGSAADIEVIDILPEERDVIDEDGRVNPAFVEALPMDEFYDDDDSDILNNIEDDFSTEWSDIDSGVGGSPVESDEITSILFDVFVGSGEFSDTFSDSACADMNSLSSNLQDTTVSGSVITDEDDGMFDAPIVNATSPEAVMVMMEEVVETEVAPSDTGSADPVKTDDKDTLEFDFLTLYPMTDAEYSKCVYVDYDSADYNRLLSGAMSTGYLLLEPVLYNDSIFVAAYQKRKIYLLSVENASNLSRWKRFNVVSLQAHLLYSVYVSAGCRLTGVLPVYELCLLKGGTFNMEVPRDVFERFCYIENLCGLINKAGDFSEEELRVIALANAFGHSLCRSRFLNLKSGTDDFLLIRDNGRFVSTPYSYNGEHSNTDGHILTFSYIDDTVDDEDLYELLTFSFISDLVSKGDFDRLPYSILHYGTHEISFFSSDYCYQYLYSIGMIYILEDARRLGMSRLALDITLTKVTKNI